MQESRRDARIDAASRDVRPRTPCGRTCGSRQKPPRSVAADIAELLAETANRVLDRTSSRDPSGRTPLPRCGSVLWTSPTVWRRWAPSEAGAPGVLRCAARIYDESSISRATRRFEAPSRNTSSAQVARRSSSGLGRCTGDRDPKAGHLLPSRRTRSMRLCGAGPGGIRREGAHRAGGRVDRGYGRISRYKGVEAASLANRTYCRSHGRRRGPVSLLRFGPMAPHRADPARSPTW